MKHRIAMLWHDGLKKALTFSYDDGVMQDLRLISLFKLYGLKATFNLNSAAFGQIDAISRDGREVDHSHISEEDIARVYAGFEAAIHTRTHPDLTQLSDACVAAETLEDRAAIEALVKYPVRGMAYPYGRCDERVKRVLGTVGVVYARGTRVTGDFSLPRDRYDWACSCHHNSLAPLIEPFLVDSRMPKLLSVWGHSYEFDQNDDWDAFEARLEKLGGNDDIWYAANIEIFDYILAYSRLIWTLDGLVCENPSGIDVFAEIDSETVRLPAGSRVEI